MAEIDRQRVLAMYESINNAAQVARQLHTSPSRVWAIIHKAGVEHIHRKPRSIPTPEEQARIIEAYRQYRSIKRVCHEMKRGYRTVHPLVVAAGFDIRDYKRGRRVLKPQPVQQTKPTKLVKTPKPRHVPDYVGCAIPRMRRGTLFCSDCLDNPPTACPILCEVGRITAGCCPLMAECPCAREATAERLARFEEWRSR